MTWTPSRCVAPPPPEGALMSIAYTSSSATVSELQPTPPPKPATHGDPANLPTALAPLTQQKRWVCWRWTWRPDQRRWDKPPLQASNPILPAKSNDPSTWGGYIEAVAMLKAGAADGIGYMLAGSDLGAVDLDHCYDRDTGKIDAWAQKEIDAKLAPTSR